MAFRMRESIFNRPEAQSMFHNETPTPSIASTDPGAGRYVYQGGPIPAQDEFLRLQREQRRKDEELRRSQFELQQKETETIERQHSFPSQPILYPPPVSRQATIRSEIEDFRTQISAAPAPSTKLTLLPPQQQLIKNVSDGHALKQTQLELLMSNIEVMEQLSLVHPTIDFSGRLNRQRQQYITLSKELEIQQRQIAAANDIASKYKTTCPMPVYKTPPPDFRKDRSVTEMRNISKNISPFNPAMYPNMQLRHVWSRILQYASDNYLNEAEILRVLGASLIGEPLETFQTAEARGFNLKETIEELMTLYGSDTTLNDYKRELDAFARQPGESIRKTMVRYRNLIEKFQHNYTAQTWPEILEMKMVLILKQVINSATKQYIELEENKIKRAGGDMSISTYITMAEEYEDIHNLIPKKAVSTTIQTATLGPSTLATEAQENAQQLKALKSQQYTHKEYLETLKGIKDMMAVNTIAHQQQFEKINQEISTLKRRKIDDTVMEFDPLQPTQTNNPVRADNPSYQPRADNPGNKPRADNPNYRPRADNPGYKPRADNPGYQPRADQPQQPQPAQEQATQSQNPEQESERQEQGAQRSYGNYRNRGRYNYKNRGTQMYRVKGTVYGLCMPCNATHMAGAICPKGNPDFDIPEIEDSEDEEQINYTESEN